MKISVIDPLQAAKCSSTTVVSVLLKNETVKIVSDFIVIVNSYANMQLIRSLILESLVLHYLVKSFYSRSIWQTNIFK